MKPVVLKPVCVCVCDQFQKTKMFSDVNLKNKKTQGTLNNSAIITNQLLAHCHKECQITFIYPIKVQLLSTQYCVPEDVDDHGQSNRVLAFMELTFQ